ncbi:hypothetical protein V8G54_021310 [Vigna mungo]|uniref:Uncharacterized protein n=1 Tax=Vigna mungo TaxID=3915 RepID=A0AAQ3ND99_VIGMU
MEHTCCHVGHLGDSRVLSCRLRYGGGFFRGGTKLGTNISGPFTAIGISTRWRTSTIQQDFICRLKILRYNKLHSQYQAHEQWNTNTVPIHSPHHDTNFQTQTQTQSALFSTIQLPTTLAGNYNSHIPII